MWKSGLRAVSSWICFRKLIFINVYKQTLMDVFPSLLMTQYVWWLTWDCIFLMLICSLINFHIFKVSVSHLNMGNRCFPCSHKSLVTNYWKLWHGFHLNSSASEINSNLNLINGRQRYLGIQCWHYILSYS